MMPFEPDIESRLRFAHRWVRLGDPTPAELCDARLQLHWAIQLLAAFGEAYVPARPDRSHTAVEWSPERRAFLSGATVDGSALRLGLHPGELTYRLFGPAPTQSGSFSLRGRSLSEATAWLQSELAARIGTAAHAFTAPSPEIPFHPVGGDQPFDAPAADVSELERWFHDASLLLEAVAEVEEGASPVRCWPHHFDIAVLLDLDVDAEVPVAVEDARSIGIGMAPGDDDYPEPYLYVTPRPYPAIGDLPRLPPPATWHTAGWIGAVMSGSQIVAAGDEMAQATRAASFARAAIAGSRGLLRRSG